MARLGYARASSIEQDTDIQVAALKAAGCDIIRAEKVSGSSRDGRVELANLLSFIRKGDALVVTRIDRVARSAADLLAIVKELQAKGAVIQATEQPEITMESSAGRAFIGLLSVFSQLETEIRKERQLEGIAAAKARGVYKGRQPSIDPNEVRKLRRRGMGATAISDGLGISRASVYRLLRNDRRSGR